MTLMFEDENKYSDPYFWRTKRAMTRIFGEVNKQ